MKPEKCAEKIEKLQEEGQELSKIISDHPELTPGLDIIVQGRKARGSGAKPVPPEPCMDGLDLT